MINIFILKSRKIFDHMNAYAAMAVSTIPKAHRRKRVDAATRAYRDYLKTQFENIRKESIGAITGAGCTLTSEESYKARWDLVDTKVDVMYSHKINLGTKKYSDVRTVIDTTGPMIVTNVTDQSIMLKADYPGSRPYRYPIENVMLIAYLGKETEK